MNYLSNQGDIHKYDAIISEKIWGEHIFKPMFSIIIPTYKRLEYLKESIRSVLNQSMENYEIVVVDNNDDDICMAQAVLEYIESINCSKLVYYRNTKNIGIYGNALRAAQLSKGRYVVLLNDDDLLHPAYLEIMRLFIEKYHYKGIIGSEPASFNGIEPKMKKLPNRIYAFRLTKPEFFFGCCVTSPGLCYPRAILYDIYNAHEKLLMGDQIIQYKALKKYGLTFVAFPLALYRIHDNATLKDEMLVDMSNHMCRFRKQTSRENILLWLYSKLFYKEYCSWYIESTLYFWKKRGLKKEILNLLEMQNHNSNTMKQLICNEIINKVHQYYLSKHKKNYDSVDVN